MSEMHPAKTQVLYSPNKVLVGLHAASQAAAEVQRLGGGKVLIVSDPGVIRAQLISAVEKSLKNAGLEYVVYDGVIPEPTAGLIDRGADMFNRNKCRLVLGIGGGSSLDVAKGISLLAVNGGRILDYCGLDRVPRRGAPLILMPTTAGTGSEVTRVLVLTDEKQNLKNVVFSPFALADAAIVDPALTASMPAAVTADTGIDALVHAVETYVSTNATVFSDLMAERAIEWIARYLPVAWAKGSNLDARTHMSLAATFAGIAFGSGGLGAVHALAYPLGTEYHMTHGRTNAIMLPHVMRFNACGSPRKYARIAALMGRDIQGSAPLEAAEAAADAVEDLLQTIQVSCRLRNYGIAEEGLPGLVSGALQQARLFVPNPRDLKEDDVRAIYEQAY